MAVTCFVKETDESVMRNEQLLTKNRAVLVSEGEGTVRVGDYSLKYGKGTLIFAFSGEIITFAPKSETVYMYVDFEGARGDELCGRFDIGYSGRAFAGFDGLIPMWLESLAHSTERTVDLAAESVLLYTFSRMETDRSEEQGIVRKMLKISEERFRDPGLSVNVISEELFYNPKYLSHAFKKKTGVSYSDYLNSLRIKYAVSLFSHGLDSVKNVAALSGFSDPLYFSTVFKKYTGTSPSEYKKGET
jgi:AraC-like DNA-binding protein